MEIDIDFNANKICSRLPAGTQIRGAADFSTGLLLEGLIDGEVSVDGALIVQAGAVMEGKANIQGNLYLLGTMNMERVQVNGVMHIAGTAVLSGYFQAKDFKLHAGANCLSASLNKIP